MSGQYQERERREHLKQYREKNKDRLQQKRHDYYGGGGGYIHINVWSISRTRTKRILETV